MRSILECWKRIRETTINLLIEKKKIIVPSNKDIFQETQKEEDPTTHFGDIVDMAQNHSKINPTVNMCSAMTSSADAELKDSPSSQKTNKENRPRCNNGRIYQAKTTYVYAKMLLFGCIILPGEEDDE